MTGLKKDGTMFDYALHEVSSGIFHDIYFRRLFQPMHIMIHGEDAAGTKEAADFLRKLIKEQVADNMIFWHSNFNNISRSKTRTGLEWLHCERRICTTSKCSMALSERWTSSVSTVGAVVTKRETNFSIDQG